MKNLFRFLILLMVPVFLLTSCKEDSTDPAVSDFEALAQYMNQNDLDLSSILDGWVKAATALNVDENDYSVPGFYILDIRSEEDFNAGHIKNAVNTPLVDILEAAEGAGDLPILVVCYTGQTAARGTAALRMMGKEAYSMKWGMSGWNANLAGKWNDNAGDISSPNWLRDGDPTAHTTTYKDPDFTTGETDGAAMLEARVRYMLTKPWTISNELVLGNPENYFVNNYWSLTSWDEFGHVSGAYRINEDLGISGLNYFDPDAEIVIYCYTGQTSGMVTAWMDVLGYNTKSMMFGANAIVHSELVNSDVKKKSWHGEGAGSECNFGYYNIDGDFIGPN
jgi:rhodanese-related sulfurtransferase